MLIVEPADRALTANQADAGGVLKLSSGLFTGILPKADNIANSPMDWSGTHWTELVSPLIPDEADKRQVMIAHELFHRIQPGLPIATPKAGDNAHLDTLEGRYLLQLEWRALAKALGAPSPAARKAAIADALLFRTARYARFPHAAADENALELIEGVAEYTGVRLGLATPQARIAYAIGDLRPYIPDATFVRSFAYATGPAYGLLLDRADPAWRSKLASGRSLDQLLRTAMRLPDSEPDVAADRAKIYDPDKSLRAGELKRDEAMKVRAAANQAKLVDGPVLIVPLKHMNYSFNPQTLQALGDLGTVYPTLRLIDEWGVIEVEDGALMAKDEKTLSVSAVGVEASGLKGKGWTLTLKPGWAVKAGPRKGDLAVTPAGGASQ
ncbi:MAG: hypothetical protein E8A12_13025 [Phenylobacterium sp.]|nr:MAG: hypothetical protein E8A12_13025 [Phenylobacterium sp.]